MKMSMPRWRVNGVVSNMPEFARAFACRRGCSRGFMARHDAARPRRATYANPLVIILAVASSVWSTAARNIGTITAKTTIERADWDLTWNVALEAGGLQLGADEGEGLRREEALTERHAAGIDERRPIRVRSGRGHRGHVPDPDRGGPRCGPGRGCRDSGRAGRSGASP